MKLITTNEATITNALSLLSATHVATLVELLNNSPTVIETINSAATKIRLALQMIALQQEIDAVELP